MPSTVRALALALVALALPPGAWAQRWSCTYEPVGDPEIACERLGSSAVPASGQARPTAWGGALAGAFTSAGETLYIPIYVHVGAGDLARLNELADRVLCEGRANCAVRVTRAPVRSAAR